MAANLAVPIFLVTLAGKRVSGIVRQRMLSCELHEQEKQAAEFKLVLAPEEGERIEDLAPAVGAPVRIQWGYPGALEDTGEMVVHSVTPSYGAERKVEVVARDKGSKLGDKGAHQVWANTELGEVVRQLAKQAGLKAVLPQPGGAGEATTPLFVSRAQAIASPDLVLQQAAVPTAPREAAILRRKANLAQRGRSPRQLLQDIAAQSGCELSVKGDELHLVPKHLAAKPRVVLRFQGSDANLLEFAPKHHRGGKHEAGARGVVAAGVDRQTGQPFAVAASDASQPGRPVLGKGAPFSGDNADGKAPGRGLVLFDSKSGREVRYTQAEVDKARGAVTDTARRATATARELLNAFNPGILAVAEKAEAAAGLFLGAPGGDANEAKARAEGRHRDAESGGVKMHFRAVGDPRIRRGAIVEVVGVPAEWAGLYIVTSCSHPIVAPYEVSGEMRRHGGNKVKAGGARTSGQPSAAKGPASGQPTATKQQVYYRVDSKRGGEVVGTVVR